MSSTKVPLDELVLLFSDSFEEGAIVTTEGFITFLKRAPRDEVAAMSYAFLTALEASYTHYELIGDYEITSHLLGTYELQ